MPLIVDGNKEIKTPIKDLLEMLRQQLYVSHIDKLNSVEYTQNNARVTCPIHSDGHEKTPSCDILLEDKERFGQVIPAGTVHCFASDTEIITSTGIRKIGECNGEYVSVLNGNGDWERVLIDYYGDQPLYKVVLSSGGNQYGKRTVDIYCTSKHRWFYKKSYKAGYIQHETTTDNLPNGVYLPSVITHCCTNSFDVDGLRHGFIYGDGFKHHNSKYCKCGTAVFYTKRKKRIAQYFNNVTYRQHPSGTKYLMADYVSKYDLTQPPPIELSNEYKLGFIIGYFAADGSFGSGSHAVSSANIEHLTYIRNMCISLGIMCKPIYSNYRLGIDNKYSYIYSFKVFVESLPSCFDISHGSLLRKSNMTYSRWRVLSVEATDIVAPVYCCKTSTSSFVLANNILTGNCFGCGWRASFVTFVANCLNISYRDATEWILNISTYDYVEEERKIVDIDNVEKEVNNYDTLPIVTLDELKSYDYIHPYMFKRRLTDEIINKFDVGYDPKTQALTFPVWVDGKCLFVARRKVNYKRFDMPEIYPKPIYGLDYLTTNEVIVCESVLNALTCYVYGKEAVALFGTGSDYQISLLNKLPQREIILALDNDTAGRAGTKRLIKQLHGKIITYMKVPEGKDINDLEQHEFEKIYSEREIV